MSERFVLRLADDTDNEQLLDLTRRCPMEGSVTLCIERSPRFLTLNELQGERAFVAVAEGMDGRLAACASIALRRVYVDGVPVTCFYGGDLKVAPDARGRQLPRQLHDFLLATVGGGDAQFSYSSVVGGNRAARVLTGTLDYRPAGEIRVLALEPPLRSVPRHAVETPIDSDVPRLAALLDGFARRHNFGRVWTPERLERDLETVPGLSLDAFRVVRRDGEVAAVLAAWDQQPFQRTRVLAYPRRVAIVRPLVAWWRRGRGLSALPRAGRTLSQLSVTHLAVAGDDPALLSSLLAAVGREERTHRYAALTFALAATHPLLGALEAFRVRSVCSRLFVFTRPGSEWVSYDFGRCPPAHEISHL